MKNILIIILAVVSINLVNCNNKGQKKVKLTSLKDSASYVQGAINAQQIIKSGEGDFFDKKKYYAGLSHVFDSSELQIPESEFYSVITKHQKIVQAKRREELKHISEENLDKGKAFLQENKTKEGIKITKSGLQYKIIKTGKGRKPKLEDKIKFHYHGTLIDGTVFDSSIDRNQPIEYPLKKLIKGWQEAIPMMPVGSEWMLYIPPDLAYGERDLGDIGPNSTLIFKIQLLEILKDKKSSKKRR